jgi:hypothetical protein
VYNLEIVSLPASDQPEEIRAIIGKRGEELRGALAKRVGGETRVRLLTTLDIGGPASPQLDAARREQVKLSETRWWRKNCTDICSGAEHYAERKGEPFDRPACFKTCVSYPPSIAR